MEPATAESATERTAKHGETEQRRRTEKSGSTGQIKAPNLKILNLRLGRNFVLGRRRFEAAFDTFNLLNAGSDQQFLNGGNQLFSANYAARPDGSFLGVNRQPPRSGQLTVRYVLTLKFGIGNLEVGIRDAFQIPNS